MKNRNKSISTVWMSRAYWPLRITFLVFSALNAMPEVMASSALTRPHLSSRRKDFPSYRFISSFISHKQFSCSASLLFKRKPLFDITFPLLDQMRFIFHSLGDSPAQQVGTAVRAQSVLAAESSNRCWLLTSLRQSP